MLIGCEVMNINKTIKFIMFAIGIILIITFSGHFLQSKSPLDLLFISMGLMAIISAFYYETDENTLNETIAYFVDMLGVNVFQWLIFAYNLYISQFHVTLSDFIILAIVTVISHVFAYSKKEVDKKEGFALTAMYIAYMVYIIIRN